MDIPKHSHAEFFRAYFSRPELLGSLLRFALPKDLSSALELSTPAVDGGTYIDEPLREHFSDLAATVSRAGRELPQTLTQYIPRFAVEVLNLAELPDSEIPPAPAPLSAGLWALKYTRTQTEKTLAALDRLAATVGKALVEHETFAILKLYLIAASPYEPAELIEMVNRLLQTAFFREEVVNTAEKLKQEGRREGVREERRRTAERLLAREFSVAEVAEITGLTEAEVQAIAAQERQ